MTAPTAQAEATAHTPGPWRFSEYSSSPYCWLEGSDGATVYHVDGYGNHIPNEADARLIAAAPDLVAALKDARRRLAHIAGICGVPNAIEACRLNVAEAQRAQAEIDAALARAGIR